MADKCRVITSARSGPPSWEPEQVGCHLTTFGHSTGDDRRYQPAHGPRPLNERWSRRDACWWGRPTPDPAKDSSGSHLTIVRRLGRLAPRLAVAKIGARAPPKP